MKTKLVSNEDFIELSKLITEISYRIDNLKASTLYELCTHDVEFNIGSDPIKGSDAIQQWGVSFDKSAQFNGIRHMCTNCRFVQVNDNEASGITLLAAYYSDNVDRPNTNPFAIGEDHDTFIKTENGWKLKSRLWVPLMMRQ